jgi:serine/threonine-protein kinase
MESILAEERVSLSHFSHPNVARLIDSGQFTDGTDYLVSEYVDALSIDDILAIHGKIGELRAARVIRQAAGALNEAHQQGILHRDLRPGNLVIEATSSDAEQTKLVNFGASSGEPNEQNLGYKAPEVLDGRVPTISSDIFSLAAVAYEMLTGTLPFAGENVKEILRSQSAGLEVLPTQVRPELAKPVDHILEKALAFNAADRYPKARDFGDAFYAALTELPQKTETTRESLEVMPRDINQPASKAIVPAVSVKPKAEAAKAKPATIPATEPAWKNRSPEPPETGSSRIKWIAAVGLIGLLALLVGGWYYIVNHPVGPEIPVQTGQVPTGQNGLNGSSPISADTEMPPFPRDIPQPPNTNFYQNSKQNLRGDLLLNFVGFTLYYPKDWKVNSPIVSSGANSRGKFLDISRTTPEDRMKEQMLISYYPSKGTFSEDADKFPQLVKEMNDVLKKLPGFRIVSQGDIKLNGEWRAYEVKFQSTGTWPNGEKYELWGRRLFVPAARPGVRNGFEITMLATSIADEVRSLDDVGVKGELASILYTFEPSQNF